MRSNGWPCAYHEMMFGRVEPSCPDCCGKEAGE